MIKRNISKQFSNYLKTFPIIAIIGPRQAGKTTFVKKELKNWRYFDLENPSDFFRIKNDPEFFFREYGNKCILDEVQVFPEIFPILRSYIDKNRRKKGQIVLLGSANPLLISNISESLAGRVGFLELSCLMFSEVRGNIKLEDLWLKGGYPEPLKWSINKHFLWIEQYIKTFIEKDIMQSKKISLSTYEFRTFLIMIAHTHGKLWNASRLSSSLGISYHTINDYLNLLDRFFLIRKLEPYYQNIGKRLVKNNKFYYRDSGLLHYLLNILSTEELRVSPYRGISFEGFIIENLIHEHTLKSTIPPQFFFFRTSQGDEIDLLVKKGNNFIAYEIKLSETISESDIKGFLRCLDLLEINKGIVINMGENSYQLNNRILVKTFKDSLNF